MDANKASLAKIEVSCTGKPMKLALDGDVPFAIDNLRYFAGMARSLNGVAAAEYMTGYTSFVRREPIGVVGAITPWNYRKTFILVLCVTFLALMMAVWKAGPALAMGNTVVIKPAPNTPFTTIEFARLALKVLNGNCVFLKCFFFLRLEFLLEH